MSPDHDCFEHRVRKIVNEGDDVYMEECSRCGRVRHETRGIRPMAWFPTPGAGWPWKYAYSDPKDDMDGPERWRFLATPEEAMADFERRR